MSIEDIIDRNLEDIFQEPCFADIESKVILITGAGGTIGAELSRQLISYSPKKIILLDNNEYSLYMIEKEIEENQNFKNNILTILGDFYSSEILKNLFINYNIDIIFHTAAYKHVNLVEKNPLQGIKNNALGTYKFCRSILDYDFKGKFILISTDKAFRPTNIMGATKRLSEVIVGSFSYHISALKIKNKLEEPKFTSVRFGNIFNSSGSVVPLFKEQIMKGGPITLTSNEVSRFFITKEEAAHLVLHVCNLTKGGDIFLLDLGNPIRIKDLALKMIDQAGLKLRDASSNGDIEIKIIGLKKGEKISEALQINNKLFKTKHPLILKADAEFICPDKLWPRLDLLDIHLKNNEFLKTKELLKNLVPEYISF